MAREESEHFLKARTQISFTPSLLAKGFRSAPLLTFVRNGADQKSLASEDGE